jgi:predicted nucleic acid-binding protein
MTELVVDTSVAIKWYVPEEDSADAVRLLDSGISFSAPDLIGPELANTLWKKVRRGEITGDEASAIVAAFEKLDVEIYPSAALLPAALNLALSLDRSVYDSLYVALAVARDCAVITADRKFVAAVRQTPFSDRIRVLGLGASP